ncbi:VanZ family protein, partial [Arthrobacter sp. EH-1B-1]
MGAWTWPAIVGVLFGTAAFLVILVPVLAYQYRRYGRFTARRVLGVAAVSVYGAAVVAYTQLPLPDSHGSRCPTPGLSPQWQPFSFVSDIAEVASASGTLGLLTSRTVLQVFFNVLLLVPWGVILHGFAGRSVLVATLTGLAASLVIEATQATGMWGFYECPYRLGDVDDLILNTSGALLGALVAPVVLWWMPRPQTFRVTQQLPRPVTNLRRWVGMAVDLAAFHLAGFALVVMYRLLLPQGLVLSDEPTLVEALLLTLAPALVVFFLPAWRGTGASIGQHAMRLIPEWKGKDSWGR